MATTAALHVQHLAARAHPVTERRRATRERLLDAATETFAEVGLQASSVALVCERAGFTRGAFYSNFTDKEELFRALLSREYAARATQLRRRTAEVTTLLQSTDSAISPSEAAHYVSEFFGPTGNEATWFALETEFVLLALREPGEARGFTDFLGEFRVEIGELVEQIVHAARRRFTIPVDRALPVLGGVYERAFRITALQGPEAPEGLGDLGERIAELIFALTESDQ